MLAKLVHFSLRFRGVILALACLVVGYGLYVAKKTKLDVFPEFEDQGFLNLIRATFGTGELAAEAADSGHIPRA